VPLAGPTGDQARRSGSSFSGTRRFGVLSDSTPTNQVVHMFTRKLVQQKKHLRTKHHSSGSNLDDIGRCVRNLIEIATHCPEHETPHRTGGPPCRRRRRGRSCHPRSVGQSSPRRPPPAPPPVEGGRGRGGGPGIDPHAFRPLLGVGRQ